MLKKNLLSRNYKYYAPDPGLRRGYKVYIGKVDNLEVAFAAKNRDGLKYYQVALTIRDEKVLARELRSIQKDNVHFPKIL